MLHIIFLILKPQLDKVKDNQIIHRSTIERRSLYRSIRMEDARYADSVVGSPDYMVIFKKKTFGVIGSRQIGLIMLSFTVCLCSGARSASRETLHVLCRLLVLGLYII